MCTSAPLGALMESRVLTARIVGGLLRNEHEYLRIFRAFRLREAGPRILSSRGLPELFPTPSSAMASRSFAHTRGLCSP
jgi:hypothetical protein